MDSLVSNVVVVSVSGAKIDENNGDRLGTQLKCYDAKFRLRLLILIQIHEVARLASISKFTLDINCTLACSTSIC